MTERTDLIELDRSELAATLWELMDPDSGSCRMWRSGPRTHFLIRSLILNEPDQPESAVVDGQKLANLLRGICAWSADEPTGRDAHQAASEMLDWVLANPHQPCSRRVLRFGKWSLAIQLSGVKIMMPREEAVQLGRWISYNLSSEARLQHGRFE